MNKVEEQITLLEAIELAKNSGINVTPPTLRIWCKRYKFGHQLGIGKWMVFKSKYVEFLNGRKEKNGK